MHSFARCALMATVAATFTAAACGGTVVVDDESSGSGGAGAGGSSSSTSTAPSSSSGLPSTVSSTSTGPIPTSASSGPCQSCAEAVGNGQVPAANICPGISEKIYGALVTCLCAEVCAGACADNVCIGNGFDDGCVQCLQSSCVSQLTDCANDI